MTQFPPSDDLYVIAEIGGNHGGDFETAKRYLERAAESGADAVKFQIYRAETLIVESSPPLPLAGEKYDSQFERFKELELTDQEWRDLMMAAEEIGVDFAASIFDADLAEFVADISPFVKIASGDLTNIPLLRRVNNLGIPVVLSTGFATMREIRRAVAELDDVELTLLHCVGSYPTPSDQAHLQMIDVLAAEFDVTVGYSDHTVGTRAPLAAIARGACVVEKHFTLDKTKAVGDHRLSATPSELTTIVEEGSQIYKMVDDWQREKYLPIEEDIRTQMRRSLATATALKAGEKLQAEDVIALRPSTGISPIRLDEIIGATIVEDLSERTLLTEEHLEEI